MNDIPHSIYPSAYYRVSLKAVIENEHGEILCVKEKGSDWTLPGGGLDHGESVSEGLDRELHEELDFPERTPYSHTPIGHDVMHLPSKQAWLLWVIFRVDFDVLPTFEKGVDADDLSFIDPRTFEASEIRSPTTHL